MFSAERDMNKLSQRAVRQRSRRQIAGFGQLRSTTPGGDPVTFCGKGWCATTDKENENADEPKAINLHRDCEPNIAGGKIANRKMGRVKVHRSDKSGWSLWCWFR